MKMPSVMTHNFSQIPQVKIPRSQFNRSHGYKTTFDAGYLIPFYVDEALPGDTFNLKLTAFARMATPIQPLLDNLFLDVFYFAIPLRLVWTNFQRFMGERYPDPDTTIDLQIPEVTSPGGGYAEGSLQDYMGLPTQVASLTHSALFTRCYNLCWNEFFRDQNLQDSVTVDLDDGPDDPANYVLLKRGKRHDYFTSALPWAQKGDPVELNLGTSAPINRVSNAGGWQAYIGGTDTLMTNGRSIGTNSNFVVDQTSNQAISMDPGTGLVADLSSATASTINQLREAFQIQKLLERDARGGTRYTEIIRSHFGVISPDARLQRPEVLHVSSSMVNITPVAQTSSTDATTPQGNLSAFGTCTMHNKGFIKSFTEHSIILGLICARADLNYQQGLNRMFSRSTRYEFYWPSLSHIGEQEVLNKEIYADGSANDDLVFGYQERHAEYRYKPSIVTGAMRSNAATSLDSWHLSQDFASLPALDDTFIQENPPVDRVIAVPTEPHFLLDTYTNLKCARPMPLYGIPGLIDHF